MTLLQAPLSQSDAAASLLSLSIAAAGAAPVPISQQPTSSGSPGDNIVDSISHDHLLATLSVSVGGGSANKHHRRLSSTGKTRRRLSDARDAANRPSPVIMQSAASALASLSLTGNGAAEASDVLPSDGINTPQQSSSTGDSESKSNNVTPIPIGKNGRRRGVDHKCESCSKIYRHPSCLIKHRWEHTPHWREASKFVLSKHQQVQLLEAAAILSHLSPSATGASLPDDRSLWPSFLSGGSLPKTDAPTSRSPASATPNGSKSNVATAISYPARPVSSSVPSGNGYYRSNSSGPRLHDYSIPTSPNGSSGITQLRPGLVGVSTGPSSAVVMVDDSTGTPSIPVPAPNNYHFVAGSVVADSFMGYRSVSVASESWTSSSGFAHSDERSATSGGGWSLPRSSLRSISTSSQSRSRSGSASAPGSRSGEEDADDGGMMYDDDESIEIDIDEGEYKPVLSKFAGRYGSAKRGRRSLKREDDVKKNESEWDGLEMEMDMD